MNDERDREPDGTAPDGVAFRLAADQDAARALAQRLFESTRNDLARVLPPSAEVLHVGATAIPGCLTKGDLDIAVRVDPGDFAQADACLAERFSRNAGSVREGGFAAFEDAQSHPHLGIQLVVRDGALDVFHRFAEALGVEPVLLQRYNALKRAFDGKSMSEYRSAKDAFVSEVSNRWSAGSPRRGSSRRRPPR